MNRRIITAAATVLAAAVLAPAAGAEPAPPTAFPLQTARSGHATLGYRDVNPKAHGTPLVLISGYGLTMAEWDPRFVERIARDRRVILFDNRGIGRSSGPVAGLTIRSMARDTARLIAALGLKRVDVLGWSMGGYIAQRLTLDHPALVRRLLLVSTDPGSPHAVQSTPAVARLLNDPDSTPTDLLPILFPADRQAAGGAWYAALARQPDLRANDFATPAATMAAQTKAEGRLWYGRGRGTYRELPRIDAPTWIGYGAEDVVVPPANARLLARRIPGAVRRGYPDAGHAFLFQDPVARAATMARFLDRRAG